MIKIRKAPPGWGEKQRREGDGATPHGLPLGPALCLLSQGQLNPHNLPSIRFSYVKDPPYCAQSLSVKSMAIKVFHSQTTVY